MIPVNALGKHVEFISYPYMVTDGFSWLNVAHESKPARQVHADM